MYKKEEKERRGHTQESNGGKRVKEISWRKQETGGKGSRAQ
jgi:hypothetical protein